MSALDARLKIVSWTSQIFSLGVTSAVRRQIGKECWDYAPETMAIWILDDVDSFSEDSSCKTYPTDSPSLGWEMRYEMEILGFKDCSSLVELHQNSMISCVRHDADARAFATFAYMIGCVIVICLLMIFCSSCCFCYR